MMVNRPQPGKAGSASRDPFLLNLPFLNMQGYRMNEVPADSTTLKPNRGPEFFSKEYWAGWRARGQPCWRWHIRLSTSFPHQSSGWCSRARYNNRLLEPCTWPDWSWPAIVWGGAPARLRAGIFWNITSCRSDLEAFPTYYCSGYVLSCVSLQGRSTATSCRPSGVRPRWFVT